MVARVGPAGACGLFRSQTGPLCAGSVGSGWLPALRPTSCRMTVASELARERRASRCYQTASRPAKATSIIDVGDQLGRRQQEELAGVGCARLQQARGRVATGVDLNGVERDAGGLDVVAGHRLAIVDRILA